MSQEEETGSAPDGDEDAIVGMIFALKAVVALGGTPPTWYDEVRKWADASCSSFLQHNTAVGQYDARLLKLGSCWGGWDEEGQNPSYHSPGSFKIMRDFHIDFPDQDRDYELPNYGSGSLESHWQRLIDTSYAVLDATQCPDQGMFPNWATVTQSGTEIEHAHIDFDASGTDQWEFGSEASRTIWRLAFDAAVYPNERAANTQRLLEGILDRLDEGLRKRDVDSKFWSEDTVRNKWMRKTQCSCLHYTPYILIYHVLHCSLIPFR